MLKLRGRPAHTPGLTSLSYTPDGSKLITLGVNNAIRVFESGSEDEPKNIDNCPESNTCIAAQNEYFISGSDDGSMIKYSLNTYTHDCVLMRSTLPVRDISISPDDQWVAVASDELNVKIVKIDDMTQVITLDSTPKSPKHVSYDPNGVYLALSCTNGIIYIYSIKTGKGEIVKQLDGLIPRVESDSIICTKVIWHPNGTMFCVAKLTHDLQLISSPDWKPLATFNNGHTCNITAIAWCPNGTILASAGEDNRIILWKTDSHEMIYKYDGISASITSLAWQTGQNNLAYCTMEGELFIYTDIVPGELVNLFNKPLASSKEDDKLNLIKTREKSTILPKRPANGPQKQLKLTALAGKHRRQYTPDSFDEIIGDQLDTYDDDDGFVVNDEDDDNSSDNLTQSIPPSHREKRTRDQIDEFPETASKRRLINPGLPGGSHMIHVAVQQGSSMWRNGRRYLCLNLIGFVWTVDQGTHYTVTIEFYDRELHRNVHFTDPYGWDKGCLTENGALFSCSPSIHNPAILYFRPHESWAPYQDWHTKLPVNESIEAISLSKSYAIVITSSGLIRVYTPCGIPVKVYRLKNGPIISCAAWDDYLFMAVNGSVRANGSTQILYSIINVKLDQTLQNEDTVALSADTKLIAIFFSDQGDPYIYDSKGTLVVLLHWRTPNQALWAPVLDTHSLSRNSYQYNSDFYWPVAVANGKFHCIRLKSNEKSPLIPPPILNELDFIIPLHTSKRNNTDKESDDDGGDESNETNVKPNDKNYKLDDRAEFEQIFVKNSLLQSLLNDAIECINKETDGEDPNNPLSTLTVTNSSLVHRRRHREQLLARRQEITQEINKAILQLLAIDCRVGDSRGLRGMELVNLLQDDTPTPEYPAGKLIEAASRVAARFNCTSLNNRIKALADQRITQVRQN